MSQTRSIEARGRQLADLVRDVACREPWPEVMNLLRSGRSVSLDGLWGSSAALASCLLAAHHPSSNLLLVVAHPNDLEDWADEITLFGGAPPHVFPAWQGMHRDDAVRDPSAGQRLRMLKQLSVGPLKASLVTCVQALLQGVVSPTQLNSAARTFAVGQRIDLESLATWLVESRFHHVTAIDRPNEFSVRGGIVDVFAIDWIHPVRIELFDDEITSIREFDVATQRSVRGLDSLAIAPWLLEDAAHSWLFDYLPEDTWVLAVEPGELQREGERFGDRQNDEPLHTLRAFWQRLRRFSTLYGSTLASGTEADHVIWPVESVERFTGKIASLREELQRLGESRDVFLICQTEAESQRLQEVVSETDLQRAGRLHFPLGRLRHGFRLVDPATVVIGESELFHRPTLHRTPRRAASKAIDSFLDLREGDLVVHLAHGIARYRGISLLEKNGHVEEHLELEFDGGAKVFVPATKIDLVQKYVGGRKGRPRLARLGGKTWLKQKQAASAAATDLAAEMLELHARRHARSGIRFGSDSAWQHEFDAAFPYQETPDQWRAIASIKSDMQTARPMDRLICGDVGFGKTELAMRAAFKAVDNGYQVGVLVPTTILAEQHFQTFTRRMAEFPFTIAKLSRFCSPAEQRETLEQLKAGKVDIVIGTHRLASRDVEFHNLGLLVIDEEQRFGVEVKDRLKMLRSTVDVLTLSATPIPRTLHMSLTGIRDISNLETAPEDRLSVETTVTRWSDKLIREAVLRELNREGQIFFVHNRVEDIDQVAGRLQRIVPEATLRIGHGQMPEGELEEVMTEFVSHRFDLLLATTIIESGLDIPNANTIFIDEANRYGLADLHQLRGRVGRYKNRAYCYLLLDPRQSVTPNAARRLLAIEEFSEMGAGFSIAMRDLEIRGAGNLLGTQQSGHIATVGYELYCQLLEAAVRRLKSLPPELKPEVDINLPGAAYLPTDYVPDQRSKIDLYRRLARSFGDDQLEDLRRELEDRFGKLPPPAERLFTLAALKTDAAIWQLGGIHWEPPYVVFTYRDRRRAEQLAAKSGRDFRLVDNAHLYLPTEPTQRDPDKLTDFIRSSLQATG